jgi:hypothetical protein
MIDLGNEPVSLGLTASLFARPTASAEVGIVDAFDDYLRHWRTHLLLFKEDDTNKFRPFGEREREYPRGRIRKRGGESIYWCASGTSDPNLANWWMFDAGLNRPKYPVNAENLSGFLCSVHPGTDPEAWLAFVLEAATRASFLFGTSGFAMVLPPRWRVATNLAHVVAAIVARYHGLDFLDLFSPRLEALDGIITVNWLTLVHDELLAKLGGRAVVRAALSEVIHIHELPYGLLFRAGPKPVSGDVNGPDELGPYREVARALRPIFTNGRPSYGHFRGFPGLLDNTEAWRNRFFEGVQWPP